MSAPDVLICAHCGERPAVCLGLYMDEGECKHEPKHCEPRLEGCSDAVDQPACDECCGHGNEDGHCHMIDEAA